MISFLFSCVINLLKGNGSYIYIYINVKRTKIVHILEQVDNYSILKIAKPDCTLYTMQKEKSETRDETLDE